MSDRTAASRWVGPTDRDPLGHWVLNLGAFTALLYRGAGVVPAPGASDPQRAARYAVVIAGPTWPARPAQSWVERYVLHGSLVAVRARLEAALERRQRQFGRRGPAEDPRDG